MPDPPPAPGAARPGSPETPDGMEVTLSITAPRTPRHYAPFVRHAVSTNLATGKTYHSYTRLTVQAAGPTRYLPAFPKAQAVRIYQDLLLSGIATDLRPVPPDRPLFDHDQYLLDANL